MTNLTDYRAEQIADEAARRLAQPELRRKDNRQGGGRMSEYIYGTDEQGGHWLTGTEIVRCRDCVHMSRGEYCYRNVEEFLVEPDGFCAWGERKVVEE